MRGVVGGVPFDVFDCTFTTFDVQGSIVSDVEVCFFLNAVNVEKGEDALDIVVMGEICAHS